MTWHVFLPLIHPRLSRGDRERLSSAFSVEVMLRLPSAAATVHPSGPTEAGDADRGNPASVDLPIGTVGPVAAGSMASAW